MKFENPEIKVVALVSEVITDEGVDTSVEED